MRLQRLDHVGIIVDDLAAAKAFFLDLGLEVQGEGEVAGAWVDRIIGLDGAKSTVAYMRVPGGETGIELIKFTTPTDERGIQPSAANTLGIRHIAFVVDDIDAIITKLQQHGTELAGEVQHYEDT
jgi:catechol 2,3-dioxygenase-like lactoylglutathione lyase family enzyme